MPWTACCGAPVGSMFGMSKKMKSANNAAAPWMSFWNAFTALLPV